jgi:hypothetical protein
MGIHIQGEHKMRMSSCLGQRSKLLYVMIRGTKVVNNGDEQEKYTTTCSDIYSRDVRYRRIRKLVLYDRGEVTGVGCASKFTILQVRTPLVWIGDRITCESVVYLHLPVARMAFDMGIPYCMASVFLAYKS